MKVSHIDSLFRNFIIILSAIYGPLSYATTPRNIIIIISSFSLGSHEFVSRLLFSLASFNARLP